MPVASFRTIYLVAVSAVVLSIACKETTETSATAPGPTSDVGADGLGDIVDARHKNRPEFYASDAAYIQKNSNFFYRIWDDTFTRKLDDLPGSGEVSAERRPYSGGYYAENDGGTNVVMTGGKSPLQKFDEAFNGSAKAVTWEREKHASGPAWAGHCNGFAAGAQRHPKEPAKNVTKNGVTFSPQDIKALIAEIYMNADYEFLGGNRCERDKAALGTPDSRVDKTKMDECEDINPGTLHVAIANWIGKAKHTLIMDYNSDLEVWNYPLYKYDVLTKNEVSEADARNLVSGVRTEYVFNPAATRFVHMQTRLTYAEATRQEILGQLYPKTMELSYVLELNAAGEVLGGEWAGAASQKNHPDFLWVALEPLEPNGTRYMGNPFIKSDEVIKLWAESAGFNPDSAPKDIRRPLGTEDWGRWPSFEVTLDGNTRGGVFSGKETQLVIKRKVGLEGPDFNLEILLNGSPLKTITTGSEELIKLALQPGLGLNRFQFIWKKDDSVIEDEYLRFHVVR